MIQIILADITKLQVDAVVNAANSALARGGGVCGAIYAAAGSELVPTALALAPCEPGGAVITPGFRLPARHVIHAVGPIWSGGTHGEADVLRRAYESTLRVAKEQGDIRSIAFPAISTGIYGFPTDRAAEIAIRVIRAHEAAFERIVACLFDEESVRLYRHALAE